MKLPIDPHSNVGRIMLALRPGKISFSALDERFPNKTSTYLTKLLQAGLVVSEGGEYWLTEAGRAACPNRRDAQPSPLHASKSNMARKHGWSSAHKAKEAAQ